MHAKWCMTIFYKLETKRRKRSANQMESKREANAIAHVRIHCTITHRACLIASNPLEIYGLHLNLSHSLCGSFKILLVLVFWIALFLKDYKDVQYYQEQVLIKIMNANKWPQTNGHKQIHRAWERGTDRKTDASSSRPRNINDNRQTQQRKNLF